MPTTTTGLATSFITFSRPGASGGGATVTDRDGKIKWAGHNLLTNSESFDASAWTKYLAPVTANAQVAPNGTTTADTITTSDNYSSVNHTVVVTPGATYTLAFWAKRGTMTDAKLSVRDVNNAVDIVAPTSYYSAINSSTWTLVTQSFTVPAGCTTAITHLLRDSFVTGTIHLWGAHLYRSDLGGMQANPAMPANMGSYYPTTPANLLGNTEAFGSWSNRIEVQVSSNVAVAPNGLQTADKIAVNNGTTSGTPYVGQEVTSRTATPYTYSIYVKRDVTRYATVLFWYNSIKNAALQFDFETVSITRSAATGSGYGVTTTSFDTIGNGWYRLRLTATVGDTITYPSVIGTNTAWTSGSPLAVQTGDGTSGVYVWGAQLSDSASLDTYVPQYGAAVTSAAYYAPRLDFDPVTLAARGLLVEEQRTNSLLSTELVGGTNWTSTSAGGATNPIVTTNFATAPSGAQTASKIVFPATTSSQVSKIYQFASISTAHSISIYLRGEVGGEVVYLIGYNGAGYFTVTCTLTTSWQRFSVSTNSATVGFLQLGQENAAGNGGMSACTIYAWGAQLEAGSFATSYIPTGSATATRTADVASVSTQAFPYSASEGTLVVNAATSLSIADNTRLANLAQSGATGRVLDIYISSSTITVFNGSTFMTPTNTATVGAQVKVAAAYKSGSYATVINGGTAATVSTATVNVAENLYLGHLSSSSYLNGHIRQITYIPRRLTNAELQSRSA